MTTLENDSPSRPRGDVRFEQPPAKLVAARPEDELIEDENERLKAERPYPGESCGGV
ncbi:hypothetical protein [Paenibacillus sp.]|uniref:hypothetical protein n=1 Tax=Paenibacillus sp. TaxID=58172 RepID=UPI002D287940|nr:hypothetical protein [Paenibacillus sp.]HZG58531.1 hypothetical protein [Paenibacillus sp.]